MQAEVAQAWRRFECDEVMVCSAKSSLECQSRCFHTGQDAVKRTRREGERGRERDETRREEKRHGGREREWQEKMREVPLSQENKVMTCTLRAMLPVIVGSSPRQSPPLHRGNSAASVVGHVVSP